MPSIAKKNPKAGASGSPRASVTFQPDLYHVIEDLRSVKFTESEPPDFSNL